MDLLTNLLTPSQTSPGFQVFALQVFLKHWEKEKLLETSFSHSVVYPFGELCAIFMKFNIVVHKLFVFGRV